MLYYDAEYLKTIVAYNPITGDMVRKDKFRFRGPPIRNGKRKSISIMIDYQVIQRSKIAWVLSYNEAPPAKIYHLDGDKFNFALSNLSTVPPRKKNTRDKGPTNP